MLEFGLGIPANQPYKQILEQVTLADRLGIHAVWYADCAPMAGCREAYTLLSAAASLTQKIKLCTGISNPYNRHPALLASMINTLQEISNGRFVLGIGAGSESSLGALGLLPLDHPLSAIREMVSILRKLNKGFTVTYKGRFHKIYDARLEPVPEQPLTIVVGGRGPKIIELMGEIGDAALLEVPPVALPVAKKIVEKGAAKASRHINDVFLYLWLPTLIDGDLKAQGIPLPTRWVTLFSVAQTPASINQAVGFDPRKITMLKELLRTNGIQEALNAVTPEMVDAYGLTGTPDEIIEKLRQIEKEGIKQVIFHYPFGKDPQSGIKLIAEKIMSHFTEG
ncbi:MAG: LLM class flavin-dependent oxidoreductase [Candidatus Ranarchaeia archaeon]